MGKMNRDEQTQRGFWKAWYKKKPPKLIWMPPQQAFSFNPGTKGKGQGPERSLL